MSFPDDIQKENREITANHHEKDSQEDLTVLREVTNGSKGQNISSTQNILVQIVNQMIDDQSMVLGYQTLFKAKNMKNMRRKRDAVYNKLIRQACQEVAQQSLIDIKNSQAQNEQKQQDFDTQLKTDIIKEQDKGELSIKSRNSNPSQKPQQWLTNPKLLEVESSIVIPYQPSDNVNSSLATNQKDQETSKYDSKLATEYLGSKNIDTELSSLPTYPEQNDIQDQVTTTDQNLIVVEQSNSAHQTNQLKDPMNSDPLDNKLKKDAAELNDNDSSPNAMSQLSSPTISHFGDGANDNNQELSKRSMTLQISNQQQSAKTTRIESQSNYQQSHNDLGKILQGASSRQERSIDIKRKMSNPSLAHRRTSGTNINSPKMAKIEPRIPSALGISENKTKSRIPSNSGLQFKHNRNESKYENASDVRSQESSNNNFTIKHKSPQSKLRTLTSNQNQSNVKLTNSSNNQMERIVPHINLKFQRNMKKMSSESRIDSAKQKKHRFNPDPKKDSDTPTFTHESTINSTMRQKKFMKNQQKNTQSSIPKKQSNSLQKSVELRTTSSQRCQINVDREQKNSSQAMIKGHTFDKDSKTPVASTNSIALSDKMEDLTKSPDGKNQSRIPQSNKYHNFKHQKHPSFQPNSSSVSVQISQNQSGTKERKHSQSGQYTSNQKPLNQTKSSKSSILFKTPSQKAEAAKSQQKYAKQKSEKQEELQQTSKKLQNNSLEPKTPTKHRDMRSGERRQAHGGMSPLVGRSKQSNIMTGIQRGHQSSGDQSSQANNNLIFQRKQSHQVLGHLSLKERRIQHQMLQNQEEQRLKEQENKQREKKQWDRAADKVMKSMIDYVLSNIAETGPDGIEHEPEGAITTVVIESIQQVEDEHRELMMRHERAQWAQAMKMVQKKMIRSVTQRCVTEIIQESTDAIYKFEDDAISLADWVLRSLLQKEIRNQIFDSVRESAVRSQSFNFMDDEQFSMIQPQEAFASDREAALEIPQERTYNPNQFAMNLFDSQTNSSKFEELADCTPSKQSQADRILYDQMMEDYSITHGKRMSATDDDPQKKAFTLHQSIQNSLINGSMTRGEHQTVQKANEMEDSRLHQSNIMRESSRGLDKIRKSVIQQQSERYLMKRGRKSNSRGSLPNLAVSSFQTSKIIQNESQKHLDQSASQIIKTQGNKPRDDEGVIVVKKFSKASNQNTVRKIQNPNDSLRFIRNPSKYSSNNDGNEVVELIDNRRQNQTPNLELMIDAGQYHHDQDRSYTNTKIDTSNNMDNYIEELNGSNSHVSGPYFGKSMVLSAQKSPKGQFDQQPRIFKGNFDHRIQSTGIHAKTALIKYQQPQSALGVRSDRKKHKQQMNRKSILGPFDEASDSKQHANSYIDHEIQRYSRNIDADEEGVRQEAQTSRLPGSVFSPGCNQMIGQHVEDRVQTMSHHNETDHFSQFHDQSRHNERRLVQMPKSRVTTINLGERDHHMTSQKKVKHATIAIQQLMSSEGEMTGHSIGPTSRISNRSSQNFLDSHHNIPSISTSLPKHAQMMSPGLGMSRQGNSPGLDPNYQNKMGLGSQGLSPYKYQKKAKKMMVNHTIVPPKNLKPSKENQVQYNPQMNNFVNEMTQKGPHLVSQQRLEDESRIQPTKGMNIKPIFQYGQQNFTHAGAKQGSRPPTHQLTNNMVAMGHGDAIPYSNEKRHKTPEKIDFYARDDRSTNTMNMNRNPSSSGRSSGLNEHGSSFKQSQDRMMKGPSLGHHSSMRKQPPKNKSNMIMTDESKRNNQKMEQGYGARVQNRKSGTFFKQNNHLKLQQESQMKRLEKFEYELEDNCQQFETFQERARQRQ